MLKSDRSFHKKSLIQPYYVSYWDQFTQTFSAISEINNGINGTSQSNYSGNDIPWRFCTSKNGSLWHILVCARVGGKTLRN